MITVGRRLILASLIVVVLQIGDVSPAPTEKSIGQLMIMSSINLGLKNYFIDLELDKFCSMPLLDVKDFKKEIDFPFPCFCTIIYNVSTEFKYDLVDAIDLETAKNITKEHKFKDLTMYNMWTNATTKSDSMKLLMNPLNDIIKWNKVCYNIDQALHSYCEFLNVEVLLFYNSLQKSKESKNPNIANPLKNLKEPEVQSVIIEELKNPNSLPQIKADKSPENEVIVDNTQKIPELNNDNNNNEELHAEISKDNNNLDDDDTTPEDEKEVEEKEAQIPTDSKPDSKSSVDYPKENDDTINQSDTKEVITKFSLKTKFTNRAFGDTEDSHFLFYFSIMTILSMLFYLALYNKKKIIALLIEGRRSTNHRRRPNTASYSKVETDDGSTVF